VLAVERVDLAVGLIIASVATLVQGMRFASLHAHAVRGEFDVEDLSQVPGLRMRQNRELARRFAADPAYGKRWTVVAFALWALLLLVGVSLLLF
jgi:hypothetical protein